eukprot:gene7279-8090_t
MAKAAFLAILWLIAMSGVDCILNSSTVSKVIASYDKDYRIRMIPRKKGERVTVGLSFYIFNMVPLTFYNDHIYVEFTLMARWVDERLKFQNTSKHDVVTLQNKDIESIWRPDICIIMETGIKHSTFPGNQSAAWIFSDGSVQYNTRLSVTVYCPMSMRMFPFDRQSCPMLFESYSYNNDNIKLKFTKTESGSGVSIDDHFKISRFLLHNYTLSEVSKHYGLSGSFDQLKVEFFLSRDIRYYIMEFYFPVVCVVFLSFTSFWIHYKATPARVALPVTTFLTLTSMLEHVRLSARIMGTAIALEIFLNISNVFVFANIIEYAIVGILERNRAKRQIRQKRELNQLKTAQDDQQIKSNHDKAQENEVSVNEMVNKDGCDNQTNVRNTKVKSNFFARMADCILHRIEKKNGGREEDEMHYMDKIWPSPGTWNNADTSNCLNQRHCNAQLRNSSELTTLLQDIMKSYDRRILPTKNGEPALVKLQMYIGDMVPVENIHMHFSIDLYLREFWNDHRLILPLNGSQQFPLPGDFMNDIWTPDIYFPLGKKGKLHDITKKNSLIRILPNGEIRSSQRVSITTFCPMKLQNFPFDQQICDFILEPYAYNNQQCKLEWNFASGGPIYQPKDLMMFEFTMHNRTVLTSTANYGIFGFYDRLIVKFHFHRNINYYLMQNYFPTFLVVVLSWVGFWIDYRSTPARVALGITTVLTITTLANSIRATLPPVSYSKSIDYYLLACFLFVFAALAEYATVGITDIKWRKRLKMIKKKATYEGNAKKNKKNTAEDEVTRIEQTSVSTIRRPENGVASPMFLSSMSAQARQSRQEDIRSRAMSFKSKDNVAFDSDALSAASISRHSSGAIDADRLEMDEYSTANNNDCAKETDERASTEGSFGLGAIVNAREPVEVQVQIFVIDMVPLKRYHMHYTMEIFFRQFWRDYRLQKPSNMSEEIIMGAEALDSIWVPEVQFPMAKSGFQFNLIKQNIAIIIRNNGRIFLSRRVSLTLFCPMNLHNFPFDKQTCKLPVKIYSYNNNHCKLSWGMQLNGPIYAPEKLKIFDYTLENYTYGKQVNHHSRAGDWDVLWIKFILKREVQFFLLQYITPCALIVILSWIGFWIDHKSTPARASLAITTVLTITTLTNSIQLSLPNVAYTKSIDIYLLACFVFVFASMVEFAIVGITHMKWKLSYNKLKSKQQNKMLSKKERKDSYVYSSENCSQVEINGVRTQELELEQIVQEGDSNLRHRSSSFGTSNEGTSQADAIDQQVVGMTGARFESSQLVEEGTWIAPKNFSRYDFWQLFVQVASVGERKVVDLKKS